MASTPASAHRLADCRAMEQTATVGATTGSSPLVLSAYDETEARQSGSSSGNSRLAVREREGNVQITVRRRPIGITILAIAAFLLGLLLGLLGLFLTAFAALAAVGALTANSPTMAFGAALAGASVAFGLVFLAFGLLCLGFAIGAWRLRPWARWLGLIGSGLGIAGSLSSYWSAATLGTVAGDATGALIALAVSVAIIVYLLTPGVRRAFGL